MTTIRQEPAEHGARHLTRRQRAMLDWIRAFIVDHGHAPTHREISEAHGINQGSVWCYLQALERKGFVWLRCGWRAIEVRSEVT